MTHVGGGFAKDVDFEYKSHNNRAFFEVEVVNKSGQEYDVIIDAKTSNVLSAKRDYFD